jgi:hypothetical protein
MSAMTHASGADQARPEAKTVTRHLILIIHEKRIGTGANHSKPEIQTKVLDSRRTQRLFSS